MGLTDVLRCWLRRILMTIKWFRRNIYRILAFDLANQLLKMSSNEKKKGKAKKKKLTGRGGEE